MANYIKLQNAGSVASDLRLLYELINASDEFKDTKGYFTKRNIAKVAAASLIVTSSGKIEPNELFKLIDDPNVKDTDNPILQNTKLIMQNLRMLGLLSTDYDSEICAITPMGYKIVEQAFGGILSTKLLLELFMNINTTTEVYEHSCSPSFRCYIGFNICYAFANLDYKISTSEMIILTTYSIEDIDGFIIEAKSLRKNKKSFPRNHPHYPKTQKNAPLKQASNLTRKINQILRYCGIIERKQQTINNISYYVCTEFGKKYVDNVNRKLSKSRYTFLSAHDFRKRKIDEQRDLCAQGILNVFSNGGIKVDDKSTTNVVFSPYQMIPEICIDWLLNQPIKEKPDENRTRTTIINSQLTAKTLRIQAKYNEAIELNYSSDTELQALIDTIKSLKEKGKTVDDSAKEILSAHKEDDKYTFYPFIHSLLNIIGLKCEGEIGRYDAYCKFNNHIIPVEIKSFTETPTYNMKGIRQAIENKICSYNSSLADDMDFGTLVIGYSSPNNDTAMINLIESAKEKWNIKIIACDALMLTKMCINILWYGKEIDLNDILKNYGIISE